MADVDRRSMLSLGVAASTLVIPTMATAQAPAGKELAPGVRQVDLGERPSLIPTYKTVRMRDIVIAPGASTPERDMMNDMKARYGQTYDQCQALATSRGYILNGFDETGENRAIMMFIEGCIMGRQR